VVTGGSAYLADIEQLFSRELGIEARLGKQIYGISEASSERISELAQAVVIGVLQYGSTRVACKTTEQPSTHVAKVEPKEPQAPLVEDNDIFHQSTENPQSSPENRHDEVEVVKPHEKETTVEEVESEPTEGVDGEVSQPKEGAEQVKESGKEQVEEKDSEKKKDESESDKDNNSNKEEKGKGTIGRFMNSLVNVFNSALGYNEEL
jgi:hypothetical protein